MYDEMMGGPLVDELDALDELEGGPPRHPSLAAIAAGVRDVAGKRVKALQRLAARTPGNLARLAAREPENLQRLAGAVVQAPERVAGLALRTPGNVARHAGRVADRVEGGMRQVQQAAATLPQAAQQYREWLDQMERAAFRR